VRAGRQADGGAGRGCGGLRRRNYWGLSPCSGQRLRLAPREGGVGRTGKHQRQRRETDESTDRFDASWDNSPELAMIRVVGPKPDGPPALSGRPRRALAQTDLRIDIACVDSARAPAADRRARRGPRTARVLRSAALGRSVPRRAAQRAPGRSAGPVPEWCCAARRRPGSEGLMGREALARFGFGWVCKPASVCKSSCWH
jgi:hypothetical protein